MRHLLSIIHEHHHSIGAVITANFAAFTIYMTGINEILSGISLLAAISFTIYKFVMEFKKNKNI